MSTVGMAGWLASFGYKKATQKFTRPQWALLGIFFRVPRGRELRAFTVGLAGSQFQITTLDMVGSWLTVFWTVRYVGVFSMFVFLENRKLCWAWLAVSFK
jgi:hypothetical protein